MKKTLSLILAIVMALGCVSITAFATTDNSTDITLTVAKALTYEMVIPEDVTNLSNFGIYSVGQAKVQNVKNATDKTVISYTAETADFKSEGKIDIPASYYTDLQGTNTFPTTEVEVYKNKADVASIPTMYVGISENAWNAAENGTYTATVIFNFEAKENGDITYTTLGDVLNSVPGGFPTSREGAWCYTTGTTGTNDELYLLRGELNLGADLMPLSTIVTKTSEGNYTVTWQGNDFSYTFNFIMKDNVLVEMTFTGFGYTYYCCPVLPTITDILDTASDGFPTDEAHAWTDGTGKKFFADSTAFTFKDGSGELKNNTDKNGYCNPCVFKSDDNTYFINFTCTKDKPEYKFMGCLTFNMSDDGVLQSVTVTGNDRFNGTYTVPAQTSATIPEGGSYKLSTGETLSAGAAFPAAPATDDKYTFGDYTYTYTYEGQWNAKVISNGKASYGELCESILGKPISLDHTFDTCTQMTTAPTIPAGVTNMTSCFAGCSSLETAPSIPASVTNMSSCFDNCHELTAAPVLPDGVENLSSCFSTCKKMTTAPTIPAGVTKLSSCFMKCEKLAGTVEINAQNLTSYMNCFFLAGTKGTGITLTGSCPDLADIAADADSEKVVVGSN